MLCQCTSYFFAESTSYTLSDHYLDHCFSSSPSSCLMRSAQRAKLLFFVKRYISQVITYPQAEEIISETGLSRGTGAGRTILRWCESVATALIENQAQRLLNRVRSWGERVSVGRGFPKGAPIFLASPVRLRGLCPYPRRVETRMISLSQRPGRVDSSASRLPALDG